MYIKYVIHIDININMENFQQELYQPVLTEPFHQAQLRLLTSRVQVTRQKSPWSSTVV